MAVRRIKESWWVDFRANYTRYRKRSPENSRAGALAYELTLRRRLARGEPLAQPQQATKSEQTFVEFAQEWFEDYVKPNNKYSEQLAKKYALASSLVPFFGRMPIGKIGAQDVEHYKAQQVEAGFTNKTIRNRLTILNKCLTTAYEWRQFDGHPPKIKWPKCAPARVDYLSPEECELLLSHADGVIHEIILTALRTGMRQGELKGLQWSSIDWQNRIITVRHSRDDHRKVLVPPKSNRERYIPMDVDVYAMLHERKRATGYVFLRRGIYPFSNDRLHHAIRKVCGAAGLRNIGWHTLRHTFASQLAMRGVPMPAIKELMGHASITTTMRYAHVAPSTLRAAIDMLNPRTIVDASFGQPVVNQWQEAQRMEISQKTVH